MKSELIKFYYKNMVAKKYLRYLVGKCLTHTWDFFWTMHLLVYYSSLSVLVNAICNIAIKLQLWREYNRRKKQMSNIENRRSVFWKQAYNIVRIQNPKHLYFILNKCFSSLYYYIKINYIILMCFRFNL